MKDNIFLKILKLLGIFLVSWFLLLLVFTIADGTDEPLDPKYDKYVLIGGIALAIFVDFATNYNNAQKAKAKIPKLKADIDSVKKMKTSLIEKINGVVTQYLEHESSVINNITEARKTETADQTQLSTLTDVKVIIEKYPDLKSDSTVNNLLKQLENTEIQLLKARTDYTSAVEKYNIEIYSFPFALVSRIFGFKEIQIEKDED